MEGIKLTIEGSEGENLNSALVPEVVLDFANNSPKAYLILDHLYKLDEDLRKKVLLALIANRKVYLEDPSQYEAMLKAIARRPDIPEEVIVHLLRRAMGGVAPVAELWRNPRLQEYPDLRRWAAKSLVAAAPSWMDGIEDLIYSILDDYPDLVRLVLEYKSLNLIGNLIGKPQFLEKFWVETLSVLPVRGNLEILARIAKELRDPQQGEELLERVKEGEAKEAVKRNLLLNPRLPIEWRRGLLGERPSLDEAFLFLSEDPETSVRILDRYLEELPDGDPALREFLENISFFPSEMRERIIAKASPKQLSYLREWGFDLSSLLEALKSVLRYHPNKEGVATGKRLLLYAFSIEAMSKSLTPWVLRQVLQDLASVAGEVPQGLFPGIAREAKLSPENFWVLMEACPEEEREDFLNALAANPELPKEAIEFLSSLDAPPESVYFNAKIPLSQEAVERALKEGEIRLLVGRYDLQPEVVERVLEVALRTNYLEMSSAIDRIFESGAPLSPRSLDLLLRSGYKKAVLRALQTAIYIPEVPPESILVALDFLSKQGMRVKHYMDILRTRLKSVGIAEEVLGL